MGKPTKIPSSEWEVMEILWAESPLSATEIYERMETASTWGAKTVRTFLSRLLQKQAVSRRKIHGMYVFEPAVRRSDCLRQESQSFIDRFFDGNSVSLVVHLLDEERLTDADMERLQTLLKTRKSARRGEQRGMGGTPMPRKTPAPRKGTS